MKKIFLVYLLVCQLILATPETEEILNDPFQFADDTQCFVVKARKDGEPFAYYFRSFAEVVWFAKEFNLRTLYFQDCDKIKKWRKIKRGD
jgi:hypothetical protein